MADDPYASMNTYTGAGASQALATSLIAPCFCGWLLHVFLFGLVAQHAFDYRHSELYKADGRREKIVFGVLVGLDALATAVSFAQAIVYGTQQQRDVNTLLLGVNQPLDSLPFFLGGLVALIVQLSLADRASKFFFTRTSLRHLFRGVVGVVAVVAWLASVGLGFLYAFFSAHPDSVIVSNPYYFNVVTCVWTLTSATVDIIITASLYYVLKVEIHGWSEITDGLLHQLIRLGTETGAMTAVTAVSAALLAVAFPRGNFSTINICLAFSFPLPSLYVLSYLVTLNSRDAKLASRRSFSSSGKRHSAVIVSKEESMVRKSGVWATKEDAKRLEQPDVRASGERRHVKSLSRTLDEEAGGPSAYRVTYLETLSGGVLEAPRRSVDV